VNLYSNSMSCAAVMLAKLFFLNFDVFNTDASICIGMKK